MNVFPHRKFAATSRPGQIYGSQKSAYIERAQYWYNKMGGKASDTGSGKTTASETKKSTASSGPHLVRVTADALNVWKGSGTSYAKTGYIRDRAPRRGTARTGSRATSGGSLCF